MGGRGQWKEKGGDLKKCGSEQKARFSWDLLPCWVRLVAWDKDPLILRTGRGQSD